MFAVELRPLDPAADLQAASALLEAALPWDGAKVVAAEKLFSANGRRVGHAIGAFAADDHRLLAVLVRAGRWIKLLAVHPTERRRGIGTMLLEAARAALGIEFFEKPRPKLRVGDHAGNYLGPGIDEREEGGQAFLRARGFAEVARNLNLRAPLAQNPCLREDHIAALCQRAERGGYVVRRTTAADVSALLDLVSSAFSPVWAHEVQRALGPELGGAAAAYTPKLPEGPGVHVALDASGTPVGFAAHDGNNRGLGWFGPTGVLPAHRGHGLGELLLLHCLRDVVNRPEGGVIAWVGPVEYYARTCGASPHRRFVVYEES